MNKDRITEEELPRFKCHKEVHALKIDEVLTHIDGRGTIKPQGDRYSPFIASKEYMDKHEPKAGGYYVVYDDGYESFSPAEAFESGYARL